MKELIYIEGEKVEYTKKYKLDFKGSGKYDLICGIMVFGKIHFFRHKIDIKDICSIDTTCDIEIDNLFAEKFYEAIELTITNHLYNKACNFKTK